MKRTFCISFLLAVVCCAKAQQNDFRKIDSLLLAGAHAEAIQRIGQLQQTAIDKDQLFRLEVKKAEAHIGSGNLVEADELLKHLSPTDNAFLQSMVLINQGYLQLNKNRNDLALQYLEQGLKKMQDAGMQNSSEGARCLSLIGLVYSSTGKYRQAESNQMIGLQIRQQLFGDQSEEVAASYNDLGLVYSQTDADEALENFEKALPIYQKIHGADHPKIAVASTNIGMMYSRLELYGDAVNNLETALAIWKKKYPEGHPNEALALLNLGQTYSKMGNQKAAKEYFEKALRIYQQYYKGKHSDIAYAFNQMGGLKLEENDFDGALQDFHKAVLANSPLFENQDVTKNPKITSYYNANVLLYSLRLKSQAFESRYFGRTLKLEDLKIALSCIYSCDSLIDDIRHHSSEETDKLTLGEISQEVYEDGVRIAHEISEMTLDYKLYREAAFYFAEKSKSAVLLESIADSEAKSYAGIPSALLDEEKNLKAEAALLTQKLAQKPSPEEEKRLRESLFAVESNYSAFTKKLEKDYPNYFNLKFNSFRATVRDFQQSLNDHTGILSYFTSDNHQRLYLFVITKKKFYIRNLTLPDNFERLIKGLTNGIYYNYIEAYKQASGPLSKLLIPHLPSGIHELVIIPSGRLGTLPFETLVNKKITEDDYEKIPFLVTRYAISYEFSAALLLQKMKTAKTGMAPSIFLCAPVQFPEKDNLDELPGTEVEVNTISKLFSGNSSIAKFTEANETAVKSGQLAKYNYLHFATHGIVDESDPELSRIFLQASPGEDGNLFSGEIYNITLNADLAVLSACQTGLGKISKGEGVIGLSRALVYAGAKNIIVSYWSVADESTSLLMTDFYKILLQDKAENFREALRQSKLKMIQAGKYAAPYYWAPFILIGN